MNAIELSEQLLNAVKMDQATESFETSIANLSKDDLKEALVTQDDRLAFWLNLYNALFQIKVKSEPKIFKNKMKLFFGKHFTVANIRLSLDEVEHDMLRASTYKWSLGYIKKPFPSSFEKEFQVKKLDPRIHFALNCGAISCPPIRFYTSENVQEQLDIATINFLEQETILEEDIIKVTSLFNWFRGDFGGMKGIKTFLSKYNFIEDTSIRVKFKKYNWETQFENFADE